MSRAALLPPVLLGLVVLLLAQMAGLAVSALLGLPIPGVVLGVVLLVVLGLLRPTRAVLRVAEPAATPLLAHLQLLFVPPGVGIILELRSLAQNALPIALAVGGSFVVTLLVAGWLLQALLRRHAAAMKGKRLVCLDIPDDYAYMQAELLHLLERKAGPFLRRD